MTTGALPNKENRNKMPEMQGIMSVGVHFLFDEKGGKTDLHKLLLELGCNIFGKDKKEKMVTHDNPRLGRIAQEAIKNYEEAYAAGHTLDIQTRVSHASQSLKKTLDLYTDEKDYRTVSLGDIAEFIGDMSLTRVGAAGEHVRNANFEIEACKKDLKKLYARIAAVFAEKKINESAGRFEPDPVEGGQKGTAEKVFRLVKLPPSPKKHADILASFNDMGFAEIENILMEKYHLEVNEKTRDPVIINAFAQIRALNRHINDLVGIDTAAKLAEIAERKALPTKRYGVYKVVKRRLR
jgi:hypothetical protein